MNTVLIRTSIFALLTIILLKLVGSTYVVNSSDRVSGQMTCIFELDEESDFDPSVFVPFNPFVISEFNTCYTLTDLVQTEGIVDLAKSCRAVKIPMFLRFHRLLI